MPLYRVEQLKTDIWHTWATSERDITGYEELGTPNSLGEATWTPHCYSRKHSRRDRFAIPSGTGPNWTHSDLRRGDLSETYDGSLESRGCQSHH